MIHQLRDKIRQAFADSSVFTFAKMSGVDLTESPGGGVMPPEFDISAVIGFTGDLAGTCALRMSSATAREALARLAGEPVEEWAELADGTGELVNMIAGNAKASLDPLRLSLSFPEVIRGTGHELGFHRHTSVFELHFISEIGAVTVIVAYTDPSTTSGQ